MHEYALVQNLLDQVNAHADARGATAVTSVTVSLGEVPEPQILQPAPAAGAAPAD